jgi:tetratricopeptide (TPR) repeat protein
MNFTRLRAFTAILTLTTAIFAPSAFAQNSGNGRPSMQFIATSLGVNCDFCHAAAPGTGAPEPKKDIARAMIAMTRELNDKVQAPTGKAPNDATQVTCATCHRGVSVPGTLTDVLLKSWKEKGADGAIARYKELRQQYYGKAAYDFSEDSLFDITDRLVRVKPDDALALLRMDLEYNPKSARAYAQIGFAYTRKYDDEAAITNYEKSLELDPGNGIVQGELAQLKSYRKKKPAN